MDASTVGRVVVDAAADMVRQVLGAVGAAALDGLLRAVAGMVDDAVSFLMGQRDPLVEAASDGAGRLTGEAVDALVASLGRAQAELLRMRGELSVADVAAVFGRALSPAALTV